MRARVLQVDNAREHVKDGVIHGIRSINTPQDHLSSRVGYLATWHPAYHVDLAGLSCGVPGFPGARALFPSRDGPAPGIGDAIAGCRPPALASPDPAFARRPEETTSNAWRSRFPSARPPRKGREADVVNLAFVGSAAQLESAFQAAGWKHSEAMSGRAALREINAFLMLKNNDSWPDVQAAVARGSFRSTLGKRARQSRQTRSLAHLEHTGNLEGATRLAERFDAGRRSQPIASQSDNSFTTWIRKSIRNESGSCAI